MIDIRQFLADNGADRKVLDTHMPEMIHHFRADRSGASVTVCEVCAPPMPIESDWPCTPLKQMAAEYADQPGYDPGWEIDWAREFFVNGAPARLEGAPDA